MFTPGLCARAVFCPARGNTLEEFQAFFLLKQSSKLGRQSSSGLWTIRSPNTGDSLLLFSAVGGIWVRLFCYAICLTCFHRQTKPKTIDLAEEWIWKRNTARIYYYSYLYLRIWRHYLVSARTISEETVGDGAITTIGSPSNISSHNIWMWISTGWKHLLAKGRMRLEMQFRKDQTVTAYKPIQMCFYPGIWNLGLIFSIPQQNAMCLYTCCCSTILYVFKGNAFSTVKQPADHIALSMSFHLSCPGFDWDWG